MKITFISSLCNCDKFIKQWINNLNNLKNFENHKLIIYNVIDTNSEITNKIIKQFSKKKNVKLIESNKENDKGLYYSWNEMIKLADTELICNFNADDKLHEDFINIFVNNFTKDPDLDLLCCPLYVSKNIKDNFENCKDLYITMNKEKVFFENNYNKDISLIDKKYTDDLIKKILKFDNFTYKVRYSYDHNISIYSFFNLKTNDFLDFENYDLRCFPGCCPVFKKKLFTLYGGFDQEKYGEIADIEAWLRYFSNNSKFKILDKPYIIYYNNPNSVYHSKVKDLIPVKKKIIKKYHPIFNFIDTKFSVIIPFKNRFSILKDFITNFNKTYEIYFDYEILVINQVNKLPFNKTKLINIGTSLAKYEKVIMSDVDLQHLKINKDLIRHKNNKLYGIKVQNPVLGGGCITYDKTQFLNSGGYNLIYEGWGSEDHDFRYRTFFKNIKFNRKFCTYRDEINKNIFISEYHKDNSINGKLTLSKKKNFFNVINNLTCIQNIINYHINYYINNKNNFEFKNNKIYFKKDLKINVNEHKCKGYNDNNDILCNCKQCISERALLFFKGEYDDNYNLIKGKIFNLAYPYHELFNGSFKNNIIHGKGYASNPWGGKNNILDGEWCNGFFKTHNLLGNNFIDSNNLDEVLYKKISNKDFKVRDNIFLKDNLKLINIELNTNNYINYLLINNIGNNNLPKKKNYSVNNFSNILKKLKINQINISKGVDKNIKLPTLSNNYDINAPMLFFGMYNLNDFKKFIKHKGNKYIVWCNNDCDFNNIKRRKLVYKIKDNIIDNFYYYDDCKKNLDLFNIRSTKIIL